MKKGISIVVLIITIIVILIIAGAILYSLTNENIIQTSQMASFKNNISIFNQELNMYKTNLLSIGTSDNPSDIAEGEETEAPEPNEKEYEEIVNINATTYEDMKEAIPSMKKEYEGILSIKNGKLVANGSKLSQAQIDICAETIDITYSLPTLVETVEAAENTNTILYVDYTDENGTRYNTTYDEVDAVENTGIDWQILGVSEDAQGQKYIKLIGSKVAFIYSRGTTKSAVTALTDPTNASFATKLTAYTNLDLATKVISVTKEDIEEIRGSVIAGYNTVPEGPLRLNSLYTLGTRAGTYYMWFVSASNQTIGTYSKGALKIRPVVYLKPTVVITGGKGTIDEPYTIINQEQ